jgi:DNA anti-recombination protein RmuC
MSILHVKTFKERIAKLQKGLNKIDDELDELYLNRMRGLRRGNTVFKLEEHQKLIGLMGSKEQEQEALLKQIEDLKTQFMDQILSMEYVELKKVFG